MPACAICCAKLGHQGALSRDAHLCLLDERYGVAVATLQEAARELAQNAEYRDMTAFAVSVLADLLVAVWSLQREIVSLLTRIRNQAFHGQLDSPLLIRQLIQSVRPTSRTRGGTRVVLSSSPSHPRARRPQGSAHSCSSSASGTLATRRRGRSAGHQISARASPRR